MFNECNPNQMRWEAEEIKDALHAKIVYCYSLVVILRSHQKPVIKESQ